MLKSKTNKNTRIICKTSIGNQSKTNSKVKRVLRLVTLHFIFHPHVQVVKEEYTVKMILSRSESLLLFSFFTF